MHELQCWAAGLRPSTGGALVHPLLGADLGQVHHALRVAPLVVVPRHNLRGMDGSVQLERLWTILQACSKPHPSRKTQHNM